MSLQRFRFWQRKLTFFASAAVIVIAGGSAMAQPDPNPALVQQGKYLAQAGDCTACHTNLGGQPFAGGL